MFAQKIRENKILFFFIFIILCGALVMGTLVALGGEKAKSELKGESPERIGQEIESGGVYVPELYKDDKYVSEEIGRKVCEKYGLDYDTVKTTEITGEIVDYQLALSLLGESSDEYLLGRRSEDDEWANSLEVYANDIHAFGGSGEIIREFCDNNGIDADKARIKDLSTEQIMSILGEAYERSDHKSL